MANPQTENGHLRVANEFFDALMKEGLSSTEWRTLLAVMRDTWGWNRKAKVISLRQLQTMTGIRGKNHISEALSRLSQRNMIVINRRGRFLECAIQKDYERWSKFPVQGTIPGLNRGKKEMIVPRSGNYKFRKGGTISSVKGELSAHPTNGNHCEIDHPKDISYKNILYKNKYVLSKEKEKNPNSPKIEGGDQDRFVEIAQLISQSQNLNSQTKDLEGRRELLRRQARSLGVE